MYTKLHEWRQTYAPGRPDNLSVGDFVECENHEAKRSFQTELLGIANGNYDADALIVLLGKDRFLKHGSWDEWARLMLVWMANYRR